MNPFYIVKELTRIINPHIIQGIFIVPMLIYANYLYYTIYNSKCTESTKDTFCFNKFILVNSYSWFKTCTKIGAMHAITCFLYLINRIQFSFLVASISNIIILNVYFDSTWEIRKVNGLFLIMIEVMTILIVLMLLFLRKIV